MIKNLESMGLSNVICGTILANPSSNKFLVFIGPSDDDGMWALGIQELIEAFINYKYVTLFAHIVDNSIVMSPHHNLSDNVEPLGYIKFEWFLEQLSFCINNHCKIHPGV